MSLKERVYSILIVSATDSFTSAFTGILPKTRYFPLHSVTSISAAKKSLQKKLMILSSSTLRSPMIWALALQSMPVPKNRLSFFF